MILYLVVIIGTTSASQTVSLLQSWEIFKSAYGKKYENEIVEKQKFYHFSKNFQMIEFHNLLYERGIKSYQMGINQFADLTIDDALAKISCLKHNSSKSSHGHQYNLNETSIPDHLDWRKKGYVTSVKDQGMCGSCWAFSAAGSLEGQFFKKSGKLVSLSEQNLVDCDKENEGCLGGWVDIAFEYIKNHGIQTKSSYPYEGKDGTCRFNADSIGAVMTGYVDIPANNEKHLIQAITSVGPISIAIDAQRPSFLFYKSGIYDEPDCHSDTLNHSLLAVGYGTLAGEKYYIVKNSWGSDWGDNGYILMSRNKDNQCGIAAAASYPII